MGLFISWDFLRHYHYPHLVLLEYYYMAQLWFRALFLRLLDPRLHQHAGNISLYSFICTCSNDFNSNAFLLLPMPILKCKKPFKLTKNDGKWWTSRSTWKKRNRWSHFSRLFVENIQPWSVYSICRVHDLFCCLRDHGNLSDSTSLQQNSLLPHWVHHWLDCKRQQRLSTLQKRNH